MVVDVDNVSSKLICFHDNTNWIGICIERITERDIMDDDGWTYFHKGNCYRVCCGLMI